MGSAPVRRPRIGMHHPTGNGSGTDNTDLNHEVIERLGCESRQHRDLRAALDLKDTARVAATNHGKGLRVLRWDGRQRQLDFAMLPQQLKTVIELRERARWA